MIWTIDPGQKWGIAAGSTRLTILLSGTGLEAFAATLERLATEGRPDYIGLECPFVTWKPGKSTLIQRCSQARTWAEMSRLLGVYGSVVDLHPGPNGWQKVHEGHVDRDAKGRSLAVLWAAEQRGMAAKGLTLAARGDGERCDAAAMWVFVKTAQDTLSARSKP